MLIEQLQDKRQETLDRKRHEQETSEDARVDAILGRDEVQVPPECGLRVIELTEAAWESARTGQPAKVKG